MSFPGSDITLSQGVINAGLDRLGSGGKDASAGGEAPSMSRATGSGFSSSIELGPIIASPGMIVAFLLLERGFGCDAVPFDLTDLLCLWGVNWD